MYASSQKGYLCLVLHAHLPYVRHPEHEFFLEENWLYEAITETYVPLLDLFSRLVNDAIEFRITLSLSPVLVEMLNDDLLRQRYKRHIGNLIELSEREMYRTRGDIHFGPVARMYHERFLKISRLFTDVFKTDIISAFRELQDTGKVEVITSAATHAFLPSLSVYPQAIRAQIKTGARHYTKNFGRCPQGLWLPECGFAPGFDSYIHEADMKFFFLDTHGILYGNPLPRYGVYVPVQCPSGVTAFGRDVETSRQVWSSMEGYPGDFDYRDFYRDAGFDLSPDAIQCVLPHGIRTYTGLKYYRITGKTDRKEPYVIHHAVRKAAEHAKHFIRMREKQIDGISDILKIRPIVTATYDAELFGHWWFEGPEWLDCLFRGMHESDIHFKAITPSEYLSSKSNHPEGLQPCEPSMSSWGDKGYSGVWINSSNDYVYRHLLKAADRMIYLADRFPDARGILLRALNQAAREVLLSQHSDWTFIMKNNTAAEYARKRFEEHISRFTSLYQSILSEDISEEWLTGVENRDRIFLDIDYRIYSSRQETDGSRQLR